MGKNIKSNEKMLAENTLDVLRGCGEKADKLLLCVKCDMDNEMNFTDTRVAFDGEKIYVLHGKENSLDKRAAKKKQMPEYKLEKIYIFSLSEIRELKVEKYLTTGRLVAKTDKGDLSLSCFMSSYTENIHNFVSGVNSFIETGEIQREEKENKNKGKCISCGNETENGENFCKKCSKKSHGMRRIFSFFSDYKFSVFIIVLFMLLETGINLLLPQISTKSLYDNVLNPENNLGYSEALQALIVMIVTIISIKVFNLVLRITHRYVIEGILPKIIFKIKTRVFESMQSLSMGFYTSKQTGSLMERVTRDSNNIYSFMVDALPTLIVNVFTVIGILIIMVSMSAKLTVLFAIAAPILIASYMLLAKKFRTLHHRSWVKNAEMTSAVSDRINGHRIIKSFAKEEEESETFAEISDDLRDAEMSYRKAESIVFPMIELALFLIVALIFFVGGNMVLKNEITVGTLMSFIVYLEMLKGPIDFLSWVFNWWERCMDSSHRVFEIIDSVPDVTQKDNPVILDEIEGDIEINEMDFEYETGIPIIKNLSLKIDKGTMLGIVGKTGAGKTTLVNLIARLYDVKSGSIKIDGADVRDMQFEQLRKNVGIVSQDIFLFMGTIADNIRYARPEADFSEVVSAAKAANAHEFIMNLPDGYETRVGSGGQDLSGGQRQRISIARTIIQNPKILILDEATAAMDTETERKIQHSISELKNNRTTIAIAHRLSTLKDADNIAVIADGELAEFGTFESLLDKKGEFYKLYKIQNEARKQLAFEE